MAKLAGAKGNVAGEVARDATRSAVQHRDVLLELIEASNEIVVVATKAGVIQYANRAASALLGEGPRPATLNALFSDEAMETVRTVVVPAVVATRTWTGELTLVVESQDAVARTVAVNCVGHCNGDDHELTSISLLASDISEYKRAEQTLRDQATRDALTGLPNRAMLLEHLAASLARGERTGLLPAVMFLDLDGFKAVNDGLGHEAGDELLIEVGKRLLECVRATDVVARFGGDEFVILLDNISSLDMARQVADRIIARVEEPVELSCGTGNVGTSIGISLPGTDEIDSETLLGQADTAMYRAKQLGKRRHQFFDDDLRARAAARDLLRSELVAAIEDEQFWVSYTPVASVVTGDLSSFEAGLRWAHPTRGELGPSEFMLLAREAGVSRDLDRIVIDAAVAQAQLWNVGRERPRTVWLTVGVQDLLSGDLQTVIAQAIERAGIAPGSLGIEIPLNTLTKHPVESQRALQALNWNGVRIAIDDFGAEHFAPAQLQRYYADTVKLDRRMITALAGEPEAVGALAAVTSVCRSLGLEVVAKGVDKVEELELLQELGCTNVQGNIVAKAAQACDVQPLVDGVVPWIAALGWPARQALTEAMSKSQMAERMLRLRMAA